MTNINITAFAGDMLKEAHGEIRSKIWDKLPEECKAKITPETMTDNLNIYLAMLNPNEIKDIVSQVVKEMVRVKIKNIGSVQ